MRQRSGFTLIELLVSIILMVILLSAVTLIFVRTTETVAISQARVTVYTNARYALDVMENDLLGCLPFNNGTQRMILENGRTNPAPGTGGPVVGTAPTATLGSHYSTSAGAAADLLLFRATTSVGNTVQTAEVCYHLVPGNRAMPIPSGSASPLPTLSTSGGGLLAGDPNRGGTLRPPYRPIYTLVRRVRVPDPGIPSTSAPSYTMYPLDAIGPNNPSQKLIPDMELCYFVLSFNVEYLGSDMSFSQIDTAPGLNGSPCPPTDPLGDGGGTNDGAVIGTTGLRLTFLRVTLVIVEDAAARQERQIQKTISIPMG